MTPSSQKSFSFIPPSNYVPRLSLSPQMYKVVAADLASFKGPQPCLVHCLQHLIDSVAEELVQTIGTNLVLTPFLDYKKPTEC